jgi:hypothetical protein
MGIPSCQTANIPSGKFIFAKITGAANSLIVSIPSGHDMKISSPRL